MRGLINHSATRRHLKYIMVDKKGAACPLAGLAAHPPGYLKTKIQSRGSKIKVESLEEYSIFPDAVQAGKPMIATKIKAVFTRILYVENTAD